MLFAQLTPTRDSTSELLDAPRHREVAVFGHSTPGQTRTPHEGNGTPKRNFFLPRGESRIARSSRRSTTAAAALHKPLQLRVTLRYFTCWKA